MVVYCSVLDIIQFFLITLIIILFINLRPVVDYTCTQ